MLAAFWLKSDIHPEHDTLDQLRAFNENFNLTASEDVLSEAAKHLGDDDAGTWVVRFNFFGHPQANWTFLIDAVAASDTSQHLGAIAAGPAEHLLAHYGSLIPLFEDQAARDAKFARMLTGVWRHRMSDAVWERLRVLQGRVHNPLFNMIPLCTPLDATGEILTPEDRETNDKGFYIRNEKGGWSTASHA